MSTENQEFDIESGPSKFDLMVSLFDNTMCREHRTVEFSVKVRTSSPKSSPAKINVQIHGVEREDGSGESWNFTGLIITGGPFNERITGYYATRSRRGYIKIEK